MNVQTQRGRVSIRKLIFAKFNKDFEEWKRELDLRAGNFY